MPTLQNQRAKSSGPMFELNAYADFSQEEFASNYLGAIPNPSGFENIGDISSIQKESNNLAQTAYQPRIRNQGSCGACWAFSAVAAFEKFYFDKKGQRLDFSQQHVVDCQRQAGGCSGAYPPVGLYFLANSGAALASAYPYKAVDGACQSSVTTYKIPTKLGEEGVSAARLTALVSAGIHVQIGVVANGAFRYLSKTDDVYDASASGECGRTINHAINAVQTDSKGSYVRIINSFGTSWGVQGTKKIKMCSSTNIWGTSSALAYPY